MRTIEEILSDIDTSERKHSVSRRMAYEGELVDTLMEIFTPDRPEELCNAERDGRCVVLPCKVGDTVYELSPRRDKVGSCYVPSLHAIARWIEDNAFGDILFLTREAAERALKGRENDGE